MSKKTFRFTDDMDNNFSEIKSWVNDTNDNFNHQKNDREVLELVLELVQELFVQNYNEDPSKNFPALQRKYVGAGASENEFMVLKKQLQDVQSMLLFMKMLLLNYASDLDNEMLENYLIEGTHAQEINSKINELIQESVSKVVTKK